METYIHSDLDKNIIEEVISEEFEVFQMPLVLIGKGSTANHARNFILKPFAMQSA